MAHDNIAFHRKYRPSNISEYMGEAIKNRIINRFKDPASYPQVILLHGTRGCGKTSAARLIAKEYHCIDKKDGHACGECYRCKDIEEDLIAGGSSVEGVQEVDIASESGKKEIDNILNDFGIPPLYPTVWKILILDEIHVATVQSQNRLLKEVEEPEKFQVFIFCTTDPDKLLPTLRSRCQLVLEVKRPSVDELADKLREVCVNEGIETSIEALKVIAKKSGRIPREALNMLEDISKDTGNKVLIEAVQKHLGDVAVEVYMDFYRAACDSKNPVEKLLIFSNKLKDQDISADIFISGLIRFTLDCIKLKYAISLDDFPVDFVKVTKDFFNIYNPEEIDFILQVLEHAIKLTNRDEDKSELVLLTTGLRIGKTKLLALGLNDSDRQALRENKRSVTSYIDHIKDAEKEKIDNISVANTPLNDALLESVFGSEITEVNKYTVPITEESLEVEAEDIQSSDNFESIINFFTSDQS